MNKSSGSKDNNCETAEQYSYNSQENTFRNRTEKTNTLKTENISFEASLKANDTDSKTRNKQQNSLSRERNRASKAYSNNDNNQEDSPDKINYRNSKIQFDSILSLPKMDCETESRDLNNRHLFKSYSSSPDTKNNQSGILDAKNQVLSSLLSNNEIDYFDNFAQHHSSVPFTDFRNLSHRGNLEEAYTQLNPYSNFNRIYPAKQVSSKEDKKKDNFFYSNQDISNNLSFETSNVKESLRKRKAKIVEDNSAVAFHKELGSTYYAVKRELKETEIKLQALQIRIQKKGNDYSCTQSQDTPKNLKVWSTDSLNTTNTKTSAKASSNRKCASDTVGSNSSLCAITEINQRFKNNVIKKYRNKSQEMLNERKKEIMLERLRRKDELYQSQKLKEVEKKGKFEMMKQEKVLIQESLQLTKEKNIKFKSQLSNSIKYSIKQEQIARKEAQLKKQQIATIRYKQKISKEENKIVYLNQEIESLAKLEEIPEVAGSPQNDICQSQKFDFSKVNRRNKDGAEASNFLNLTISSLNSREFFLNKEEVRKPKVKSIKIQKAFKTSNLIKNQTIKSTEEMSVSESFQLNVSNQQKNVKFEQLPSNTKFKSIEMTKTHTSKGPMTKKVLKTSFKIETIKDKANKKSLNNSCNEHYIGNTDKLVKKTKSNLHSS